MIVLKVVPEFGVMKQGGRRAGFIPSDDEHSEIELWQLWCRSSESDETRRATFEDLEGAGFVWREKLETHAEAEVKKEKKRVRKKKAANKPARRKQRS